MSNDVTRPECSLKRLVRLEPGTRYTRNGISLDINEVKDGEVYVTRWPKGVDSQSFCQNLHRIPVAKFIADMEGATLHRAKENSDVR